MLLNTLSVLALVGTTSSRPTARQVASPPKAGISWPTQEGDSAPVGKFFGAGSRVSWWYDWNQNYGALVPGATGPAEFVPMIWTTAWLDSDLALSDGAPLVLGFNEPDNHNGAVATYLTPADGAARWNQMLHKVRAVNAAAKFASPAVANDQEWLAQWFAAICPGVALNNLAACLQAPDYIAVHSYKMTAEAFIADVQSYHDRFGLPVIVSEFACNDFSGNAVSQDVVYSFMGQTTQWLDAQEWIYRYAWFGAVRKSNLLYGVTPENRLIDEAGNLTPLGVQYVQGGHK